MFNDVSYVSPSLPVLLQVLSGARAPGDLLPKGSVYELPANATIEVSFSGGGVKGFEHPIHLHGHAFDVVRVAGSKQYNYANPVRRDVVNSGKGGDNVTFRFRTDNPGPWFLHCHIDWHLELGLAVVFAERTTEWKENISPPAAWDELCPEYNAMDPKDLFLLNFSLTHPFIMTSTNVDLDLWPVPSKTSPGRLPGATPESTRTLREVLKRNHENRHVLFDDYGRHNHRVLAAWAMGAQSAIMKEGYDTNEHMQKPRGTFPGRITPENFKEHLGDRSYRFYDAYVRFYTQVVRTKGFRSVLEEYVFSPHANFARIEEAQWAATLLYAVSVFNQLKDGGFNADFLAYAVRLSITVAYETDASSPLTVMHFVTSAIFLPSLSAYLSPPSQVLLLRSLHRLVGIARLDIPAFFATLAGIPHPATDLVFPSTQSPVPSLSLSDCTESMDDNLCFEMR
ncbi:laccase, multicopper oxidase, benzenediol:oxygen oxidorectuctase [Marasmius sp. AFHP31]|nr:laccase, multicopper oxidase, benzenediol:oxygen oxidorectuctase [Marasmius sp. AFHP31]